MRRRKGSAMEDDADNELLELKYALSRAIEERIGAGALSLDVAEAVVDLIRAHITAALKPPAP